MDQVHGENTNLTDDMQVRVPGIKHKFHHQMHEKILDGYDGFNTYVFLGSLRATTNFGPLDVQHYVMNLEYSRVVSRLYHNNKEYNSIINPIPNVSTRILQTIIVINRKTTVSQNSNTL